MEPAREEPSAEMDDAGTPVETDLLARMKRSWRMVERPFASSVPVIGPLIVFIRKWVNRIAVRWYVPMLLEHQYRFNRQVVELAEIQTRQADLISDRGLSIATLAEEVARLSMRLAELEERVAHSAGREGREGRDGREGRGDGASCGGGALGGGRT